MRETEDILAWVVVMRVVAMSAWCSIFAAFLSLRRLRHRGWDRERPYSYIRAALILARSLRFVVLRVVILLRRLRLAVGMAVLGGVVGVLGDDSFGRSFDGNFDLGARLELDRVALLVGQRVLDANL